MNEVDLSQAVKEALTILAQELGQSYSLPLYLKPLLNGEATVVFKVFKGKIQLAAPVKVIEAITEEPLKVEVEKLEMPKPESEASPEPEKPKRKRKSEV